MKRILFVASLAAVLTVCLSGCTRNAAVKPDWFTNAAYFEEKNGLYEELPVFPKNIVMVGDDYIDRGVWCEFYADTTLKNRGITYDATEHVLYRIDKIAAGKPAKIFVSAGRNDLLHGTPEDIIVKNVQEIFARVKKLSPKTKLYYLNIVLAPSFDDAQKAAGTRVNEELEKVSAKAGFKYIDLNQALASGLADGTYSWDEGKFLNGAGYAAFARAIQDEVGKEALNEPKDHSDPVEVSDYYKHRVSVFRSLPPTDRKIVMLGNSLNNNAPWEELFPMGTVINRGISGDIVKGVCQRVEDLAVNQPYKIYLLTGCNDLVNDPEVPAVKVWEDYEVLIKKIVELYPFTAVYVQSILPLNPKSKFYEGFNERAEEINKLIAAAAARYGYLYLDIAALLSDEKGDLREDCTTDGIHLSALGYYIWAGELAKGNRMILEPTFEELFK